MGSLGSREVLGVKLWLIYKYARAHNNESPIYVQSTGNLSYLTNYASISWNYKRDNWISKRLMNPNIVLS